MTANGVPAGAVAAGDMVVAAVTAVALIAALSATAILGWLIGWIRGRR